MATPGRNIDLLSTRVQVVVRSRPMRCVEGIVDMNEPEGQVIVALDKAFSFDACFDRDTSQESIYGAVVQNLVEEFVNRRQKCATILAYGQTGTGKTYTMIGSTNENMGIIPRAVEDIFRFVNVDVTSVGISFYEILNDKVYDLLSDSSIKVPLTVREESGTFHVPQLKLKWIESATEALSYLESGVKTRAMGSTASNANSSRSHAIFRITLAREDAETGRRTQSNLSLVDLAGSESVRNTNAQGERLIEAKNINRGLLALGSCISAIYNQQPHVPFRDSTLTKVLKENLHDQGRTTLLVCISPDEADLNETLTTLRYADRAKSMKKPKIPAHLLNSARKRRWADIALPPTPANFKRLNNTIATPFKSEKPKTTPKFNHTVDCSKPVSSTVGRPDFSFDDMSDMSSIVPPPSTSTKKEDFGPNVTLVDASTLSPMLRMFEDRLVKKLENKFASFLAAADTTVRPTSADGAIISGPAFSSEVRKAIRNMDCEQDDEAAGLISTKPLNKLQDVTNIRRSRLLVHKKTVEATASPSFVSSSANDKENEISRMARSMGINPDSPTFMFADDENFGPDNRCSTATVKRKRSVRRTTMLPPEFNMTLDKGRRRSSRLALKAGAAGKAAANPLDEKKHWTVFDQEGHNRHILNTLNLANMALLQRLPAIGPKTAFILHKHRQLHGEFASLADLRDVPGLQKSFFAKFANAHQVAI